jgi:hypothetical protein
MAKKKEQVQEVEVNEKAVQEQKEQESPEKTKKQTNSKDTRVIYAGPTIINEKFFLRKGQIFTEVPHYAPEELRKFFISLSEYSPEKEKELEEERRRYIREQQKKKANKSQ